MYKIHPTLSLRVADCCKDSFWRVWVTRPKRQMTKATLGQKLLSVKWPASYKVLSCVFAKFLSAVPYTVPPNLGHPPFPIRPHVNVWLCQTLKKNGRLLKKNSRETRPNLGSLVIFSRKSVHGHRSSVPVHIRWDSRFRP